MRVVAFSPEVLFHLDHVHSQKDAQMVGESREIDSEIACVNVEEHRAVVGVGCPECDTRTWETLGDGSQDAMQSWRTAS